MDDKVIFYNGTGLGLSMSSGWVPISLLPVPYQCFEIGKNPNSYPNQVKTENTHQIGVGLDG